MKRKAFVKGAWKHLGHGPVDQFARTGQLPLYTDDPDLIANEALRLLNYFRFDVLDLRGTTLSAIIWFSTETWNKMHCVKFVYLNMRL